MKLVYTNITGYNPSEGTVTYFPSLDSVVKYLFGTVVDSPGFEKEKVLDAIKTSIKNNSKYRGMYFRAQTELR